MRGFFARMGARLQRFMYGRYGSDELSYFLSGVSLVFLCLSVFRVLWWMYFIGLALMVFSAFRSLSRNLPKRRAERQRYLRLTRPLRDHFALQRNRRRDRKTHLYFKCKQCRAVLRVPRNKGTIDVTCPRCHTITVKKT